ncbi:MAG: zinc-binding alcohol dehydrogenase [Amaricoccus sp.]|nr:zinc-binding alcohol dehydrogenase [Amaricoccus sp.]MBP7002817.1 zinc-binding alcohol dehydrogenase [Amaricoccus sp.]
MSGARALWLAGPGQAELREEPEPVGEAVVAALFGGISRGTEALVARGGVPEGVRERMRAPFQAGAFPFPVKYGYAVVGRVVAGPEGLRGRTVFVLHPHQDRFAVPAAACVPLPGATPAGRAVLAANLETALNVVWDAGVGPCDRVVVIGAGVVGALAGWLCARMPGVEATLVDVNPARAGLAARLGCGFAPAEAAPAECDVVIHASGTEAGLAVALAAAGEEATVVEASWHGDRSPAVPLGAAFHARRLRLVSSQVGRVPPGRAPRWTTRRRLEAALALAADPALDALISGETAFTDLPAAYAGILDDPATLCHRVRYL